MKKIILLCCLLFLSAAEMYGKTGVWGNLNGLWIKSSLTIAEEDCFLMDKPFPKGRLHEYQTFIMSSSGVSIPMLAQDIRQELSEFVQRGGLLYLDGATVLIFRDTPDGLQLEKNNALLGAGMYGFDTHDSVTFVDEIFSDSEKKTLEQYYRQKSTAYLYQVTRGEILIGGKLNHGALLLANRFGTGMVLYSGAQFSLLAEQPEVEKIILNLLGRCSNQTERNRLFPEKQQFIPDFSEKKVASWGNLNANWQKALGNPAQFDAYNEKQRLPLDKLSEYDLVILSASGVDIPFFSKEEIAGLINFVRGGGIVYCEFAGVLAFREKADMDLSSGAGLLGMSLYGYDRPSEVALADNPVFTGVDRKKLIDFYQSISMPYLDRSGAADLLIKAKYGSLLTLNRIGKGAVIFSAPSINMFNDVPTAKNFILNLLMSVQDAERLNQLAQPEPEKVFEVDGNMVDVYFTQDSSGAAVNYLSGKIAKLTGKRSFLRQDTPDEIMIRCVTDDAKLNDGIKDTYGYKVHFDGKTLTIAARNTEALLYGASEFLKNFTTYRILYDGPGGEVINPMEKISLPSSIDWNREPSLRSYTPRWPSNAYNSFHRSNRYVSVAGHMLHKVVSPKRFRDSNPEYFPEVGGKRIIPAADQDGTWNPCMMNPRLVELAMEYADEFFRDNPDRIVLPMGVNDGAGDCQCAGCLELQTKYNNQYIRFYNDCARELGKRHPGKYLCFFAYNRVAEPAPKNIELEPNIIVEICSGFRRNFAELEKWKAAGLKHPSVYDYNYSFGAVYGVPRYYPHWLGNAWKKAFRDYGLFGITQEIHPDVWVFEAPRQYVLNELAWDMDANIDAILSDYFSSAYGEAGEDIGNFFNRLEAVYGRMEDPLFPMYDWMNSDSVADYSLDDVAYLDSMMTMALSRKLLPQEQDRLRVLNDGYLLSRNFMVIAGCIQNLQNPDAAKEDVLDWVAMGAEALDRIQNWQMPPEAEKKLFSETLDLKTFKKRMYQTMRMPFETAADNALKRIDDGSNDWQKLANGKTGLFKTLLLTRTYLKDNPRRPDLAVNGGFEFGSEKQKSHDRPDDWKTLKGLKGWSTWHFDNSITDFGIDFNEKFSGKSSGVIRESQEAACFLNVIPIEQNARYHLSFQVKRSTDKVMERSICKEPGMAVRFRDKDGNWVGDYPDTPLALNYGKDCIGKWAKKSITFSTYPGAAYAVIVLSAPLQNGDAAIWFDDLKMEKIYQENKPDENASH